MKRITLGLTLAGLLAGSMHLSAEDRRLYTADTSSWIRTTVPEERGPGFPDTVVLKTDPFAPDEDRAKANGKGNGNGNGNGEERKHISDNSFLIEEAYNQEPGVVQHIFNWVGSWGQNQGRQRDFNFAYTMELPVHSMTHQFSFVFLMETFFDQPDADFPTEQGGIGDTLLNYRYQLLEQNDWQPAVAPRFSLILPTGDEGRGLGAGELGYQFNLPISKEIEPFAFHFNAGFTFTPNVTTTLATGLVSPERDLRGYNLGASVIWLATYDLNLMLELVAFWNEEVDDGGFRDHTTEVIINPAVRYAVYTSDEVQWVLGVGAPIGLSRDAADYGVFGYMSVEHNFKKMEK